jgi:hypothetical protein
MTMTSRPNLPPRRAERALSRPRAPSCGVAEPGEPSSETVGFQHRDDAGLRVVGRLLLVALAAGALIGGITVQLLVGFTGTYASASFLGASIGMPVAAAIQLVNVVALYALRRRRPGISLAGMRAALVPLPTLGAISSVAGLSDPAASISGVVAYLIPAGLSAVTAWSAASWCLAPFCRSPQPVSVKQSGGTCPPW